MKVSYFMSCKDPGAKRQPIKAAVAVTECSAFEGEASRRRQTPARWHRVAFVVILFARGFPAMTRISIFPWKRAAWRGFRVLSLDFHGSCSKTSLWHRLQERGCALLSEWVRGRKLSTFLSPRGALQLFLGDLSASGSQTGGHSGPWVSSLSDVVSGRRDKTGVQRQHLFIAWLAVGCKCVCVCVTSSTNYFSTI